MANQTLPTPQIILDENGFPVPGAQVFYYQSGTLTLIPVYLDLAGTIAATNPVIADGSGMVPQTFINGTGKAIIKDALGATLYPLDPLPVIQSVGSGANQISFNPTVLVPENNVQSAIQTVDANWRAANAALPAAYQPLDADLTQIAGLARTRGDVIVGGASAWVDLALGATTTVLTSNGTDVVYSTPIFSKEYTSAEQTITVAGLLTLAHGLTVRPKLVGYELVCKTAEFGFAVNDVVPIGIMSAPAGSGTYNAVARIDATNIVVRYGNDATTTFLVLHATTGASQILTNANWRLVVRAWA